MKPAALLTLLLLFSGIARGQTPRLFLVPHGLPPSVSTPGQPVSVEVFRGSTLELDVYIGVASGSVNITGVQFEMPCTISAGDGAPISYSPASTTVDDSALFACTSASNRFDQATPGNCPSSLPGGLAVTSLEGGCPLSNQAVLLGSITYRVPAYIPEPIVYQIRSGEVILTGANQAPILVQKDGVDASICCPPIPATSAWGIVSLFLALLCAGTLLSRRYSDATFPSPL